VYAWGFYSSDVSAARQDHQRYSVISHKYGWLSLVVPGPHKHWHFECPRVHTTNPTLFHTIIATALNFKISFIVWTLRGLEKLLKLRHCATLVEYQVVSWGNNIVSAVCAGYRVVLRMLCAKNRTKLHLARAQRHHRVHIPSSPKSCFVSRSPIFLLAVMTLPYSIDATQQEFQPRHYNADALATSSLVALDPRLLFLSSFRTNATTHKGNHDQQRPDHGHDQQRPDHDRPRPRPTNAPR